LDSPHYYAYIAKLTETDPRAVAARRLGLEKKERRGKKK
jgi:hypothetical protein